MTQLRWRVAPAVVLVALLSACGGGNGDDAGPPVTVPTDTVPDSANASAGAYTRFAASLVNSETAAPLTVNAATPPTSESEAPQPVG